MALKRMDNIGIVVDDLGGAIDFFCELGLEIVEQSLHGDASSAKYRRPMHYFGIACDRFLHESIVVQIPVLPDGSTLAAYCDRD
jgi:catechol 2,3-dioxygenase-like lactoylglutathione lyase family enzyme